MTPEEILRARLDHYEEEVKRLRQENLRLQQVDLDLRLENDRLQNSFIDINLDCDKKLEDAQEIVVDLLATGERLAIQLEDQQLMEDKYNGWWNPSFATARVWIAQKNK